MEVAVEETLSIGRSTKQAKKQAKWVDDLNQSNRSNHDVSYVS